MKEILAATIGMEILSELQAESAMQNILSGDAAPAQAAAFLAAIEMRGMHLPELRGFHSALSRNGITVDLGEENLIDVCGTGGDGKNTFNISTAAAFVLAGAGIKVAKHGNASATSGCGSSDVLAHLGVGFTDKESKLKESLAKANICYLHAPLFQPALKFIAPVRKEIGIRTFFNMLGPLINPARPRFQFIGLADPGVMRLYRYFLEKRNVEFALVHSRDGYDEISLTGAFDIVGTKTSETFYPEDLGFETTDPNSLLCKGGIEKHAEEFLKILGGTGTKVQTNTVIANAAFAIRLMLPALSLDVCKAKALESINSGAAMRSLDALRQN